MNTNSTCYDDIYVEYLMKELSDDEVLRIARRLGVDYSHTTWQEEKWMVIEDCVFGLPVAEFSIEAFKVDMSRECGTPISASLHGDLILYHSEDKNIRGYTTIKNWCNEMLKS